MDWAITLQSFETTKTVLERAQTKYEAMEDFAVHAFLRDTGAFVLSAGALKKQRVKNKITERFIQIDCPAL